MGGTNALVFAVAVCALASLVSAHGPSAPLPRFMMRVNESAEDAFARFVSHFSKPYLPGSDEYAVRLDNFKRSLERHAAMNAREAAAGGGAVYGVNFMSDLSVDEFRARYLSPVPFSKRPSDVRRSAPQDIRLPEGAPQYFDLRLSNPSVLGPMRDQQKCGGCWAISTVEVVETAFARAGRPLVPLSTQQVISCDLTSSGCIGGRPERALAYMQKYGVMSDASYPFVSAAGTAPPCAYDANKVVLRLDGTTFGVANGEVDMLAAFIANGTLSVAVNADTWGDYVEGTIQRHCDGTVTNHAVQVVGYNLLSTPPVWIIKNSWSINWGMGGYLYLAMYKDMCLIGEGGGYYLRMG